MNEKEPYIWMLIDKYRGNAGFGKSPVVAKIME